MFDEDQEIFGLRRGVTVFTGSYSFISLAFLKEFLGSASQMTDDHCITSQVLYH